MRVLAPVVLLSAVALTGSAHAGNNEFSIGSFNRALRSSSANALTDETLGGGTLAIGRDLGNDLGLALYPGLQVWATGAFGWGGAEGMMFQTLSTELDTLAFTLGGRARYLVHPRFVVGARLDLGTARTALTLSGNGHTVSDAAWGAVATAATTVDLLAIAHRSFSLGLRFELGYVTASAPALSPREENDSSMITLDEQQASIGHLDLGGRFFSLSVLSQF